MTRFDRAILWLADRVPVSFVFIWPLVIAWVALARMIIPHLKGPWQIAGLVVEIAGGGLIGNRVAAWEIRWRGCHGFDRCYDCWRVGRWAIRITTLADDSLAIPEPPPSHELGCWCQKHATDHLVRFMWAPLQAIYSEVSLVPYDRNWGRLVNQERESRR